MKHIVKLIVFLAVGAMLFGCSIRQVMKETDVNTKKTAATVEQTNKNDEAEAPSVVVETGYYVDSKPVDLETQPSWLKNRVSINGQQLPFNFLVSHILRNTGVIIKYSPETQKGRLVSLAYTGSVKGALDTLASKTNYAYDVTDQDITWAAFISKTFNIAFMPGTATYLVGKNSGNNNTSSGGSSSGTSGSNTTSNSISAINLNDQQYSGLQGNNISLWNDLKSSLNELKSQDGKVYVSESTTSVTVYDRPSNVDAIGRYIAQLNKDLSRQVKLRVQVLELELDKAHNLGVDWNVVQHLLGGTASLTSKMASATNLTGAAAAAGSTYSPAALTLATDKSNVILQALSMQGKLSVVTEPTVTTMNNQVAEIRITKDTSYLASVNLSMATSTNNTTTATLTPGTVTEGFTLYLLPKIKDAQVYLQISSTLGTLVSMTTFETPVGTQGSGEIKAKIQTPTVSEKRFNMRTLVDNGSTLVIGGFRQKTDQTQESKLFGMKALGGEGAHSKNVETILLITPIVSEN